MVHTRVLGLLVLLTLLLAALPLSRSSAAGPPAPAAYPETTIPQAGGDAAGGADFLVSTAPKYQVLPEVAHNATDDTFLAVWNDDRSGNWDVYGQIHAATAIPLGAPLPITTAAGHQLRPAVAYNSAANEYLVAWVDMGLNISVQRVSAAGTLVGSSVVVSPPTSNCPDRPDLLYDPNADHYLVVWQACDPGEIQGQLLDNQGNPLLAEVIAFGSSAFDPRVAYNDNRGSYMVVFSMDGGGSDDIYGQAIAADGTLTGPVFAIGAAAEEERLPDVAFDPANLQYLVVWERRFSGPEETSIICGRRIDEDGNSLGDEIDLSPSTSSQEDPAVAYNPDEQQFLVVWSDERNGAASDWDIYAQRVRADGTLPDQGNFAVSTARYDQYYPTVAYSTVSHQYLLIWYDDHNLGKEIYGQRLHWLGFPLGAEFCLSAAEGAHEEPAVAYNNNDHEYLLVWTADPDGDGDTDIYGRRYDRDGLGMGEPFAIVEAAGSQTHPVIQYRFTNGNYMVLWDDEASGQVRGCLLTGQGAPVPGIFTVADGMNAAMVLGTAQDKVLVVFSQYNAATGYDIRGRFLPAGGPFPAPGDDFAICGEAGDQTFPAVAYDATADRFLVAWSDARSDQGDIHVRCVLPSGNMGADIAIATAADAQTHPALAANSPAGQMLVVWHDYRDSGTSGADLYGRLVSNVGPPEGDEFALSTAAGDQMHPYVNFIGNADKYYVGWEDSRNVDTGWDIYGMWLNADGSPGSLTLPAFRYSGWQMYPTGAFNADDNEGIIVWQDGRSGAEFKVYARLGVLDEEPPVARFTVDPTVGRAGATFTFDARASSDNATPSGALLVRWDWTSNGSWDTPLSLAKVVTQTVMAPGIYTVTLGVWDMMLYSSTVSHAVIVLPAGSNTPPNAMLTVSPTADTPGSTFTLDASASTDGETPGALTARWDYDNDGVWETGWGGLTTTVSTFFAAGDYTARVEVRDAGGLTDAAIAPFGVIPGPIVAVEIEPLNPTVQPYTQVQFRALAYDAWDNLYTNAPISWTVTDPTAGTINAGGLFTASNQVGTYTDIIQAESNGVTATTGVVIRRYVWRVYLPVVYKNQ